MPTAPRSLAALTPKTRLILIGLAAVVVGLLAVLLLRSETPDDAVRTREVAGVPAPLPRGILPAGATDVTGTLVERSGEWLSAAVEFTVPGTDRDVMAAHIEQVAAASGWTLDERVYDATTMVIRCLDSSGSPLTITLRSAEAGDEISGTIIAVRAAAG